MRQLITTAIAIATFSASIDARAQIPAPADAARKHPAFDPRPRPTVAPPPEEKSPATALLLSLGSTLAPVAAGVGVISAGAGEEMPILHILGGVTLISAGTIFGPSVGYFYAGEWWRGLLDIGIRGALGVAAIAVLTKADGNAALWGGIGLASAAGIYGIYGIFDSARAAKRMNARNAAKTVSVAPLVAPTPEGNMAYGLALVGRF